MPGRHAPGRHARIYNTIWHDSDFTALSSGAQRMYLLALSQDTLTLCGVTTYTDRRWSRLAANTTPAAVRKDIAELSKAGFVVVDEDTEELWIRSFLKHDGVLASPNMILGMANSFETVHSGRIRSCILDWFHGGFPGGFRQHLHDRFPDGFPKGFPDGFCDLLDQPFPNPSSKGLENPSPRGLGKGSGNLAHARTPSPSPAPTPVPVPEAVARTPPTATARPGGRDERRDGVLRTETRDQPRTDAAKAVDLAKRLAGICTADNRAFVNSEAAVVVTWALQAVAAHVVDEAIGWAEQKPPILPRAIAPVIASKASDHGVRMPEFNPRVAS